MTSICVWQMKPTEVIFWADLFWQSQFAWVVTSMMRNRDKVRGLSIKGSWKQKNFLDTTSAVFGTFKNYMEGLGTCSFKNRCYRFVILTFIFFHFAPRTCKTKNFFNLDTTPIFSGYKTKHSFRLRRNGAIWSLFIQSKIANRIFNTVFEFPSEETRQLAAVHNNFSHKGEIVLTLAVNCHPCRCHYTFAPSTLYIFTYV